MATAKEFMDLWKRDKELRAIEEGSPMQNKRDFSRSKLALSPGDKATAPANKIYSASCEVEPGAVGI